MDDLFEIIIKSKNNDCSAQKLLYDGYYSYCMKLAFRYLGNYDKAIAVVHNVYVRVFTQLDNFLCSERIDVEINWMRWLKVILINTTIDTIKNDNLKTETPFLPSTIWNESRRFCTNEKFSSKELILKITKLPSTCRTVFNLYVIDGYSHLEISRLLQISAATSESKLLKARILLQKDINEIKLNSSAVDVVCQSDRK